MRVLEITADHDVGLYDSDTGVSLEPEKLVDISDEVADDEGRRTLLLFTRAKRGRIVKIVQPYKGEAWMGSSIHFFVDELDAEMKTWDNPFGHHAKMIGIDQTRLANIIRSAAPAAQ